MLALICALGASCPGTATANDDLVAFFDDVVFAGKQSAKLYKWRKTPSIRLETIRPNADRQPVRGKNDLRFYRALSEQVDVISELSGLNIRLLPNGMDEGGDIVVQLMPVTLFSSLEFPGVSRRFLRQLTGPGRCFFLIWPNADSSISKGRIIINNLLSEDHIKHCFYEEIIQSLGAPNDSDRLQPSIFNEAQMIARPSAVDALILHALYDPLLAPGMDRLTALDKVRAILERKSDR